MDLISKQMSKQNNPVALGKLLEKFLREQGLDSNFAEHTVCQKWSQAVGEAFARNSRARSFRDGKLIVETESSSWRSELFIRREKIRKDLNSLLGKDLVKVIELR